MNRKLIIPFTVVILIMVAGMVAYVFFWQGQEGKEFAGQKLGFALTKLNSDFSRIQMANRDFANKLSRDNTLIEALNKEDRGAISALFKSASDGRGFSGFLTAYDENGKVIFSSDTPAKFGYSLRGKNSAVDYVLANQDNFIGPTYGLSAAQSIAMSAMMPIISADGQCVGIIAVSEPLDEEFLTGEATKFALISEPLVGIDLVLLGVKDRGQIYCSPSLLKERPGYLRTLSEQGVKALPNWQDLGSSGMFGWFTNLFNKNSTPGLAAGFVKDNRFWQSYSLIAPLSRPAGRGLSNNNGTELIGVILASTPMVSQGIKPAYVILASCIMGLAAVFSIIALSTQLKTQPDENVLALIERLKKWRADKRLPPGNKFSGALGELSELIDQTLIDWQSIIQTLKVQLNKASTQTNQDKPEQAHLNDEQFEALNRQLANQNRQLSEFSRQLNHANQQAVFLQNELEAILQITTEGILILDQYGNIIHANNIFSNWLGTSEGGIAGRFCLDLIKRSDESTENKQENSVSARPFVKQEGNTAALVDQFFPEGIIYNSQTNKTVEISMNLQQVISHDNRVNGYILVARDKSLRSEISGLKMEIVTMLARAIRGPLMGAEKEWQNIIASQPEIADQTSHSDSAPEYIEAPEEVHIQLNRELNQELKPKELTFAQKLANLHSRYNNLIASVDSMLTTHGQSIGQLIPLAGEGSSFSASDLESIWASSEPVKESFPLAKLVSECLKESSNLAREKQLLLDYKTSTALPNVTADRALTKSILSPIIEKMISITAPGGKVRAESSSQGKEIQLSIASSGPALSEEETADIFAGFNPEKHEEDSYGSRLALYLARNNAERIGAKVWVQSETRLNESNLEGQSETQGTTVYIIFALA